MKITFKADRPELAPWRGNDEDAGFDVRAAEGATIPPMGMAMVSTGLKLGLPKGYHADVRPRSGLMAKHAIVAQSGLIDSGYRGTIKVCLTNHSRTNFFEIVPGDRIAQLVIHRDLDVNFAEGDLTESGRGENGFGSSGRQ